MASGFPTSPFRLGQGGRGVLLIHGFCGSPIQMRYLAQGLHGAGYTVSVPMLPGHGTTVREMEKTSFREWHDAVRRAYTELRLECPSVAVAGHSLGGVLALLLAEEYPVDAVIPISAPMYLAGLRGLLAPFSPLAALLIPYASWPAARHYPENFLTEDHICYEETPLARVHDLCRLMRRARRDLFAVTAPLFVIQSRDDPAVSSGSSRIIAGGVSSAVKKQLLLTHSGHLVPLGPERREALDAMIGFLDFFMPRRG